jgi:tRNA G18 (ribose-2'-O)-methylase SpoU
VKKGDVYLILHDIRSAHNVGAIFRTADAVGATKVFLTGYTPAPLDRFLRPRNDIAKAALGAERTVSWESAPLRSVIARLHKGKVQLIAVEQDPQAVNYKTVRVRKRCAFIFGNEVDGLPAVVLKKADIIAEIPMYGSKESLNVSVAAGIALFQMLKR